MSEALQVSYPGAQRFRDDVLPLGLVYLLHRPLLEQKYRNILEKKERRAIVSILPRKPIDLIMRIAPVSKRLNRPDIIEIIRNYAIRSD